MGTIIELKGVNLWYEKGKPNEVHALKNIDLKIEHGNYVAFFGPSGCGKSTLLNIVGLLDNQSSGKYFFDGTEVGTYKERQRTQMRKGNIGFVFQSFNLIDELTVFENVELPLIYLKKKVSERIHVMHIKIDKI